ncbi:MAG: hypothetical protein E7396_02310 [Ruminococcaceae bacterium]|nr:hypothetical protein [Oscillospiraceae bacterium]
MKKFLCMIMAISLIISSFGMISVFADSDIKVQINGKACDFDTKPMIINSRTMVPMRAIFEALGAKITWVDRTKTVVGVRNQKIVKLTINSPKAYIDGAEVTLDSAPVIVDSRTYVPVRFVSEALGEKVDWDGDTKTVIIDSDYLKAVAVDKGLDNLVSTYHRPIPKEDEFKATSDWNDLIFYDSDAKSPDEIFASLPEGKVIFDKSKFMPYSKIQKGNDNTTVTTREDPELGTVLVLETKEVPEDTAGLIVKWYDAIKGMYSTDDVMLLKFKARTVSGGQEGIGRIMMQIEEQVSTKFYKALFESYAPSPEWTTFYTPIRPIENGDNFGIRFGYFKQKIEVADLEMIVYSGDIKLEELPVSKGAMYQTVAQKDAKWRNDAIAKIPQVRSGDFTVKVVDKDGNPVPDANINVEQYETEFRFGSALNGNVETKEKYRLNAGKYFNTAVAESASKWDYPKAVEGSINQLKMFRDAGIKYLRGHVLVVGTLSFVHPTVADAYKVAFNQDTPDDMQKLIQDHIYEYTDAHLGLVEDWDVENEHITHTTFADKFGYDLMKPWYQWTREGDPGVKLCYNDYKVDDSFTNIVQKFHDLGYDIDAIGMQSHYDTPFASPEDIAKLYEFIGNLGYRVKLTEYSCSLTEDDQVYQANYTRDTLLLALASEYVDDFIMWGYYDGHGIKKNAPMFDINWNKKLAGDQLIDIIYNKMWTHSTDLKSDASGIATFKGYYGDYDVKVSAKGITKTIMVPFHKGFENVVTVVMDEDNSLAYDMVTPDAPAVDSKPDEKKEDTKLPAEEKPSKPVESVTGVSLEGGNVVISPDDMKNITKTERAGKIGFADGVLTVDCTEATTNQQDLALSFKKTLDGLVTDGDTCVMAFKVRLLSGGNSDVGKIKMQVQGDASVNHRKVVFAEVPFGKEWTEVVIPFGATSVSTMVGIRCSFGVQKFEIKDFQIVNFGTSKALTDFPASVKAK